MSDFWTVVPATGCAGGPAVGTISLELALLDLFREAGAGSAGIYNCRKIEGSDEWSVHAAGRALDLTVGAGGQVLGDEILISLLAVAWELGLQRIIWARMVYDRASPAGRPYGGRDPHTSHLHIEQEPKAGRTLDIDTALAWLSDVVPKGLEMQLLVQYGSGVWVVSPDLSSRLAIASTADQLALQATGEYRVVALSAAQMQRIPDRRAV